MKYKIFFGIFAASFLFGCSTTTQKEVPNSPPAKLFLSAQQSLNTGNWISAIEKLEALDSRYPFGPYTSEVQLNLIYAYYKSDNYLSSLSTITRFTRLDPNNKNMDWVLYMRGLANMGLDHNFMHSLFYVNRSDRDPTQARLAFDSFKALLIQYPNSKYANDAQKRLISLKNRLANYDLATADYYLRRGAWLAAINRSQEIQKAYSDTSAARKSLKLQLEALQQLGLADEIKHTEQLITLNPIN